MLGPSYFFNPLLRPLINTDISNNSKVALVLSKIRPGERTQCYCCVAGQDEHFIKTYAVYLNTKVILIYI